MKNSLLLYAIVLFVYHDGYAMESSSDFFDDFVTVDNLWPKENNHYPDSHIMTLCKRQILIYEDYQGTQAEHTRNLKNEWGDTELHRAVESGDLLGIVSLLQAGADCNATNMLGQSPLSLMLQKQNRDMQDCFTTYGGCYFVDHRDFFVAETGGLIEFLTNESQLFYDMISKGLHKQGIDDLMAILNKLFIMAQKNETDEKHFEEGRMVTIQNIENSISVDCFIKTKLSDLIRLCGEKIKDIFAIVLAYNAANRCIEQCNKDNYEQARQLFVHFPLLCNSAIFNHYLIHKLVMNKKEECWKLLFEMGVDPNACVKSEGESSPMHIAANVQNQHALYYLTLHGAKFNEPNGRGKNPIELLIQQLIAQPNLHQARMCLLSIQTGMHKRINRLQENNISSPEIDALLRKSDLITRALENSDRRR